MLPPTTTHTHHNPHPPQPTTHHNPPPPTTIDHHPLPSRIHYHHPPTPTTSQNISATIYHFPKNGPPPCINQNIFIYNLLQILFKQFLFLRNAIFLSVTTILCDKVLISSFSKLQISTTFSIFYDIEDFLKFMFYEFKVARFILFVFINKIFMLT